VSPLVDLQLGLWKPHHPALHLLSHQLYPSVVCKSKTWKDAPARLALNNMVDLVLASNIVCQSSGITAKRRQGSREDKQGGENQAD